MNSTGEIDLREKYRNNPEQFEQLEKLVLGVTISDITTQTKTDVIQRLMRVFPGLQRGYVDIENNKVYIQWTSQGKTTTAYVCDVPERFLQGDKEFPGFQISPTDPQAHMDTIVDRKNRDRDTEVNENH